MEFDHIKSWMYTNSNELDVAVHFKYTARAAITGPKRSSSGRPSIEVDVIGKVK